MAKKLKIKLPKSVAGVKIPKTVRKGPIASFLNSSGGQVILAQALVAAAGAFAVSKTDPESRPGETLRHPVSSARKAANVAKRQTAEQAARLSFALKEASRAFRAAMEQPAPAGEPEWAGESIQENVEESTPKKKSSRTAPAVPH